MLIKQTFNYANIKLFHYIYQITSLREIELYC